MDDGIGVNPWVGQAGIVGLIRWLGLQKEKVHGITKSLSSALAAVQAAAVPGDPLGRAGPARCTEEYSLSANLVQLWLTQYDRGELDGEEVEASVLADYEAKIASLERKVGQLTMELDLLKKAPRLRLVSSSESSSIVSGPKAAPSEGGAK